VSRHFFIAGAADQQEPVFHRDPWRSHCAAVETLRHAGIDPPAAWRALLYRFSAFVELGDQAADRLADEILNPNGGDIVSLRAAALAEQVARSGDDSAVTGCVQRAVLPELQALYEPVAQQNYRAAAKRYDAAAKRFTDAAKVVDVEAGGETLVTATTAQRDAWLAAPGLAGDLEEALLPLLAAAALAGAPDDVAFTTAATDPATAEHQIAIATDPGKAHRRKTWGAWATNGGRCGRWAALHMLGVKLRAASDPARVTPYERPRQPVAVAKPGGRVEYWDPHDGDLPRGWHPVATGWLAEKPNVHGVV
jgi:hypothetical protein